MWGCTSGRQGRRRSRRATKHVVDPGGLVDTLLHGPRNLHDVQHVMELLASVAAGDELSLDLLEHLEISGIPHNKIEAWMQKDPDHVIALVNEWVGIRKKKHPEQHISAPSIVEESPSLSPADGDAPPPAEEDEPDNLDPLPPESNGNNSVEQPSVGGHAPDRGGLHLPGDRYLGPFNPLENGPPRDVVDAYARIHDYRYDQLQKLGYNPYLVFNIGDQELIDNLKSQPGVRAALARQVFEIKRDITPHLHLQNPLPEVPSWAAGQAAVRAMAAATEESGAGGGALPGPAVWSQGATFGEETVTCFMTRRCYLPFNEDPVYKPITIQGKHMLRVHDGNLWNSERNLELDHPVLGYQTPWHYPDLNSLNLYFSPLEFQHLLEQYSEIAPKSWEVIVSDIVVKDVATQNQTTHVTDSPTGGLAIFADSSYRFPYVLGTGQNTLPSDIPTEVYLLPQYAYLTTGSIQNRHSGRATDQVTVPNEETDFYVLEHSTFGIYKTGDFFTHSYTFPTLTPKHLTGSSQHFFLMENPLYGCRYDILEEAGTRARWRHINKDEYGIKPQNFLPGPMTGTHLATQGENAGKTELQRVLTGTAVGRTPATRWSFRPGPVSQPYAHAPADDPTKDVPDINVDAIAHGYHEPIGQDSDGVLLQQGRLPNDREQAKQLSGIDTQYYPVTSLGQSFANTRGSGSGRPLLPGSVWNERSLHYETQIWAKIPICDRSFMADSPMLGGWGCVSPPPMLFFKMIPTPAPLGTNVQHDAESKEGGALHQYAVFNLTVKMVWHVKKRGPGSRWNPQPAVYPPTGRGTHPYLLYNNLHLEGADSSVYGHKGYERSDQLWTAKARVHHL